MKTKSIVRELCIWLFSDVSKKVCLNEQSEHYLQLVKDTMVSTYLKSEGNLTPNRTICGHIMERCRYHLYPEEYRDSRKEYLKKEIPEFEDRIRRYFIMLLALDYAKFGDKNESEREKAFACTEILLGQMQDREETDLNEVRREIQKKFRLKKVMQSLKKKTDFLSEDVIQYHTMIEQIYRQIFFIEQLAFRTGGKSELMLKAQSNQNISVLNSCIGFLECLTQVDEMKEIPMHMKEFYDDLTSGQDIQDEENWITTHYNHDPDLWKEDKIYDILTGGVPKVDAQKYIAYIIDLMRSSKEEKMSENSRLFYDEIMQNKNHFFEENWKRSMFSRMMKSVFKSVNYYQLLAYYYLNSLYKQADLELQKLIAQLEKIKNQYYIKEDVIAVKQYMANGTTEKTVQMEAEIFASPEYEGLEQFLYDCKNFITFLLNIQNDYFS
ncbi:MAG: hypothetical protein K2H85_11025 [Allobaculum sp.]|nr:hypothetical protein [Allobaculum sp.]